MYQEYYGLNQAPFHITPDPEFLFLSRSHEEALASIVYGVDQRKGFVVVLGDVGLGKTTILRFYLDKLATDRLTIAYIFDPNVTFKALLDTIYRELGIADKPDDVHAMVNRLHEAFIEEFRQGRTVVLIVDEAQNMPVDTLENLRVLSNLETSTDKLIQMVLVGQPEFAGKLERHELRQLSQRIAVRSTLVPFTEGESLAYIEHRLNKAGGSSASVFTRGALRQIVEHAKGVPRVINILCDNALVNGLGYQKKPVTARIVREAIADLTGRTRVQWLPWAWASLVAVLAAGALFLASPYRELVFASGNAPVELPALPSAPARALPVAAGDEDWLPPGEGGVAGSPVSAWGDGMAANASGEGVVATAVVREGDTLHALAAGVYGFADARILRRILEINPDIKNSDTLLVGTTIRFPAVRVAGARTPQLR
jgi:general secretion pathway protein A